MYYLQLDFTFTELTLTAHKLPVFVVILVLIFHIRTEYGEILCISLYSVWRPENTDQNNSEYRHFLFSDNHIPALNEMVWMKSCSVEYKVLKPRETINKNRLIHSTEIAIKQEHNNPFGLLIKKDSWLNIKKEWPHESVPCWKNLSKSYLKLFFKAQLRKICLNRFLI